MLSVLFWFSIPNFKKITIDESINKLTIVKQFCVFILLIGFVFILGRGGFQKKPLKVVEPIDSENLTSVISYSLPAEKGQVKLIDPENTDELVNLLHNEAKVI